MRNLTIHRAKRLVAYFATLNVYIEDHTSQDLLIDNTPCRKLGEIKNGETKTFAIGEAAAKVFVIIDQPSKSYCNEYYSIPAGVEDVMLSGRNRYNPSSGNAFRFDNVTDPAILENRKKSGKKGMIITTFAILLGFIVGFFFSLLANSQPVKPQTFSADGVQITLTNEFKANDSTDWVAGYRTVDVGVFIHKNGFAEEPELKNYTLKEYAKELYRVNGHNVPDGVQTEDGLTFYEYQYVDPNTDMTYVYFTYVYETAEGFWIVQFAIPQPEVENYRTSIKEWAKSVEFDQKA